MHITIRACFLCFFYNPYMSLFNSKIYLYIVRACLQELYQNTQHKVITQSVISGCSRIKTKALCCTQKYRLEFLVHSHFVSTIIILKAFHLVILVSSLLWSVLTVECILRYRFAHMHAKKNNGLITCISWVWYVLLIMAKS